MGSIASPIAPVVRGLPRTGASLPNALGAANDIVPGPRGFGRVPSIPTTPRLPPAPTLPAWEPPIPVGDPIFSPARGVPSPIVRSPGIGRPLLAPGGAIAGAERAAINRGLGRAVRGVGGRALARRAAGFAARGIPYVGWGLTAFELGRFGYDMYRRFTEPDPDGMPMPLPDGSPFPYAQCPVVYEGVISYSAKFQGILQNGTHPIVNQIGPITGSRIVLPSGGGLLVELNTPTGWKTFVSRGGSSWSDPSQPSFTATRIDGQPDNCAIPEYEPQANPLPDPRLNPYLRPNPNGIPRPFPDPRTSPFPDPLTNPNPLGSPLPGLDGLPFPFPVPDGWPVPDGFPYPDGLPFPLPDPLPEPNPREPGSPPTPELDCCVGLSLEIGANGEDLGRVLDLLEGGGKGNFDLTPCASEIDPLNPPDPLAGFYEGEGLLGIYEAIAQITKSLNLVRADTKCLEGSSGAALPMHFETRPGEVPQFVVLWGPEAGGSSRWSMSIPHPKPSLTDRYNFRFPVYKKGNFHLTYRLKDNSQIILNASTKLEGIRVLNYLKTLLDPAFVDANQQPKITENAGQGNIAETRVKATYLKFFEGHRNQASLWSKSL